MTNHRGWRSALVAMMLPALAWAAPSVQSGFGLPRDASLDGHRIDGLIHVTMMMVGVLFVFLLGWLLWACFRHGAKHRARYELGDTAKDKALPLGMAALVFLVIDGNLLLHSTHDMEEVFWNFEQFDGRKDVVRVEVNAQQWAWSFRYPGEDGRFGTADDAVTTNDLRVPVDTPVLLQLGAVDVVHSFYLPNFRVKMDVVPGTLNRVWFQAKEPGEFELACAQHCGTHHYKMRGLVKALPKEAFAQWVREASIASARAYDPTDAAGQWGWPWKEWKQ